MYPENAYPVATARVNKTAASAPNNSNDKTSDAIGALVTAQKTVISPSDPPSDGSSPSTGAKLLANVDPTKNAGTISPPLNPVQSVQTVNRIFKIHSLHVLCPFNAFAMAAVPAPLNSFPKINVSMITRIPPTKTLT